LAEIYFGVETTPTLITQLNIVRNRILKRCGGGGWLPRVRHSSRSLALASVDPTLGPFRRRLLAVALHTSCEELTDGRTDGRIEPTLNYDFRLSRLRRRRCTSRRWSSRVTFDRGAFAGSWECIAQLPGIFCPWAAAQRCQEVVMSSTVAIPRHRWPHWTDGRLQVDNGGWAFVVD